MPINIPDKLPAREILENENIFVMTQERAIHQDIRPLKIVILNLMPIKETTEVHLLRLLSNTPLQIEIELLRIKNHVSKNTPSSHLDSFYKTWDEINHHYYDGMIITGAPIEKLEFEEVNYWDEIKDIMDWSREHVTSTLFICWASQAALYHFYNVPKHQLEKKMFGIFNHTRLDPHVPILRGFDDQFMAPHSRHTEVRREDIEKIKELEILAESDEAGIYLVGTKDGKQFFVTGHSEYDPDTLKEEFLRDLEKGEDIHVPKNYFQDDDPEKEPVVYWRSHANLLFSNWLNYYVYQLTPYDLK